MNFSARVKIDPETDVATPILLVETQTPDAMSDTELLTFLKRSIPAAVDAYILALPLIAGDAKRRTDVWLTPGEEGEENVLHTSAYFGDQDRSNGMETIGFLRARIIEVLQNDDNWHRKPKGVWKFSREFSLEVEETPTFELKPITKDEIESIVEDGVNAMYKAIQDKIGVTTGDNAGIYHSGSDIEEKITEFFVGYVRHEKKNN